MKVTILQQKLAEALAPMKKNLNKKKSEMILSASGKKLQISVYDKKLKATTSVEVDANVSGNEIGIKLPALIFYNAVSTLPNQELLLTKDVDGLTLQHSTGKLTIRT